MILSEDQKLIQDAIGRFAREQIAPRAAEFEAARAYPKDLFRDLADLGLMGMTLDEQYGGSKTDYVSYALALIEIAAADGGLSMMVSGITVPAGAFIHGRWFSLRQRHVWKTRVL